MARVKVEKPKTLNELIPLYGEQNTQCNALKKVVTDLNGKIKTAIKEAHQENKDIVIEGWKCSLTVTEEPKMNEDKLLEVLKAHKIKAIKTKEYVDFDDLEKLIYAGKIDKEVLLEIDSCNEATKKETLRCTKVKED